MVSGLIMTVSMSCLALYLTHLPSLAQSWRWLPLPLVTLAFTGYSVGFATVPLSLIGELLPARSGQARQQRNLILLIALLNGSIYSSQLRRMMITFNFSARRISAVPFVRPLTFSACFSS